ncbi:substrate-binding periplasmic protein [Pseudoduganella sp. OTU4001]|uniref:substrate-binding periplasmic protein n=1 Tax=Pseudoduganella sp. OTU4001 TaxID=3043854 RepID=UPI00313AC6C3
MASSARRLLLRYCPVLVAGLAGLPLRAAPPAVLPLIIGQALDENGKPRPLPSRQTKLFALLERELGIRFELRRYPWPRVERSARSGEGLVFGLPKNEPRLAALNYSAAALSNTLWLATRNDNTFTFSSLADLQGKTVGAVRGYGYGEAFEQARGKLFHVADDPSSRALRVRRLLMQRVDAVLFFQPSGRSPAQLEAELGAIARPLARELGLPDSVRPVVLPNPVQLENQQFFAIARERDDGLIERINAILAKRRPSD